MINCRIINLLICNPYCNEPNNLCFIRAKPYLISCINITRKLFHNPLYVYLSFYYSLTFIHSLINILFTNKNTNLHQPNDRQLVITRIIYTSILSTFSINSKLQIITLIIKKLANWSKIAFIVVLIVLKQGPESGIVQAYPLAESSCTE